MADYDGALSLWRDDSMVVGVHASRLDVVRDILGDSGRHGTVEKITSALRPLSVKVIGPAWIGYAEDVLSPEPSSLTLHATDAADLASLQRECSGEEWEHGGLAPQQPAVGGYLERRLVSAAGYDIWGSTIAHIGVITDPRYRGHGYGRAAVAALASDIRRKGLIAQYRTLHCNHASLRMAAALGFREFARSLAVRFSG